MKVLKHTIIFLLAAVLLLLPMTVAAGTPHFQETIELRRLLAAMDPSTAAAPAVVTDKLWSPVARFYRMIGYRMVWMDADGLTRQGESLLKVIASASENGLAPEAYFPPHSANPGGLSTGLDESFGAMPPSPAVQMDMMLTDALLRYTADLARGRVAPQSLNVPWFSDWKLPDRDFPAELAAAFNADRLWDFLDDLPPGQPAYSGLKSALQQYEQIRLRGGWAPVDDGPSLRRGDRDPRIPVLRSRLLATADIQPYLPEAAEGFDAELEAGVMRFQFRHGLAPDGVVGNKTLAALNVPVGMRILQLKLNMERWRWYPARFGGRYLLVNIPDYSLNIVENDWVVRRIRVIVGRPDRQTPNLSGRMTYLEINPYWNVPSKIARKDILPKIKEDPDYLVRQGIKVFDSWDEAASPIDPESISWEGVSRTYFPYRLRQDPSAFNALGRVKFIFPNSQAVYIHDTPSKSLFAKTRRGFSSGCVRLESPLELARYLLRNQSWNQDRLEKTVDSGRHRTVVLKKPIPVHLVYFTAWMGPSGSVNFREDIYDQDRELELALIQRPAPTLFCHVEKSAGPMLAHFTPPESLR